MSERCDLDAIEANAKAHGRWHSPLKLVVEELRATRAAERRAYARGVEAAARVARDHDDDQPLTCIGIDAEIRALIDKEPTT